MPASAALLLALGLAATVTAAPPEHLAADPDAAWVAFDLTPANQIHFTMTLDGRPVSAVLDTGVSDSALSRRYADAAHLPVRAGSDAVAIGGNVPLGWIDGRAIVIGGLSRSGARLAVIDLPREAAGGAAVDLLVGRDVTGGYALDIDYAAKRFRLLPSGRLPFRGAAAPLSIGGDWPVYMTELTIQGVRFGRIAVDTGDGGAVTLSRDGWRALGPPRVPTTTTISYGLGGATVTDLTILPVVATGDLVARDVPVAIEDAPGFSRTIGVSGRIGSGFLERYHVLLDPRAGHMVLGGGADGAPSLRSTSGLLVRIDGDRLRVLHVMRGGPGADGGWHAGDEICSIDGIAVAAAGAAATSWPVGKPGRVVSLGLCGGAVRALTLRQFY